MSVLTNFADCHDVYIETGLGHGQSLTQAVQHGFATLHAIEIDEKLIGMAAGTFHPLRMPTVTIHHGSSPDVLPILIDPARQTFFWLDAHFSAGLYTSDSARDRAQLDPRFGECPLLAELAVIWAVDWHVPPVVFIDDAVCFVAETYEGHHAAYTRAAYPTRDEIQQTLPEDYTLHVADEGTGQYFQCRLRKPA